MKTPLLIVMGVVVLVAGSGLAIMNQRLQEQPSRMVHSSLRRPAPGENERRRN